MLSVLFNPFQNDNELSAQIPQESDTLKILEKVYLHTDRNVYFPGDAVWFKAYFIEASSGLLSDHSNNLHVELISPASKIIDSLVVKLDGGLGNGNFRLPGDLKSGQYRLRAYTNFMRNYGDQLFFHKEITVINISDENKVNYTDIRNVENKTEIRFYPEGGSLVDNVSSTVAFKALDAAGLGCAVSGDIYASTGEIVTRFKSTHHGMGTIVLKPLPGLNYFAIIDNPDGEVIRAEIPKSFSNGITLSILKNQGKDLVVSVKTSRATLPLVQDQDLFLTISARKSALKTIRFRMESLTNILVLPTDDLPEGIVMLTISGKDLPLCERLIFLQKNKDINIKLETDQAVYNQRAPVAVKVSLSSDSATCQGAYLSLSATEKKYTITNAQFPSTIASWFLLESDIRGPVEEPSYYFDASNPDRLLNLDLLLCTQGWRDFEWKYYKEGNYSPENGFTVSGRLRRLFTNIPIENYKVNIGIFEQENTTLTAVRSDPSGKFRLDGIELTGDARLIVNAVGEKEDVKGWVVVDSLGYSAAAVKVNSIQTSHLNKENLAKLKQEGEKKETLKKKYNLSETILLDEVKVIGERSKDPQAIQVEQCRLLYHEPDNEVIVTSALEGMRSIIDIIGAMVPGIKIYGKYPDYQLVLRGYATQNRRLEPLYLLDGFPSSLEQIIDLPVSWVDRIDILKAGTAAMFGARQTLGVVAVITKVISPYKTNKTSIQSVNIKISGYNAPRVFYSPQHSSNPGSAFTPDLRTTLFWEPNIVVDGNKEIFLNYFNADNATTIKVMVEGITLTGIPVTGTTEYQVNKAPVN